MIDDTLLAKIDPEVRDVVVRLNQCTFIERTYAACAGIGRSISMLFDTGEINEDRPEHPAGTRGYIAICYRLDRMAIMMPFHAEMARLLKAEPSWHPKDPHSLRYCYRSRIGKIHKGDRLERIRTQWQEVIRLADKYDTLCVETELRKAEASERLWGALEVAGEEVERTGKPVPLSRRHYKEAARRRALKRDHQPATGS